MKRFQNAVLEYNLEKNQLAFRDSKTNAVFFAIDFFENKEIKRVFSLYPLNVELKGKILELKFSVENKERSQNVLTIMLELNQLTADKQSIITVNEESLENIILN